MNTSFGKESNFFWHFLLVFISSVFTSYAISPDEIENDPSLDRKSEINVTEETLILQESTLITGAENIYITPGTIIYGAENISSSADNFKSGIATTKRKSFDENNILGISKAFVPQRKSKDLVLKHNQEKSIEKAKHTSFIPLSNSINRVLQPNCTTCLVGSTDSSSSKFSFDKLLNTIKQKARAFFQEIKIQNYHGYFVYFENEKISKSLLRGPPSLLSLF